MSAQTVAILLIGIFLGVMGSFIATVWMMSPIPRDDDYYEDSTLDPEFELPKEDLEDIKRTMIIFEREE